MITRGTVFHIQRFSLHDGPGIRTTVFLKGCAMRCFWCHNPEGRRLYAELQYTASRCIACGECVKACPNNAHEMMDGRHIFHRDRCLMSGECIDTCYSNALELNGKSMNADELVTEILRDRAFYESSKGGVTLSGGEPALQDGFAREILARCKEHGIHTAIETCGYCPWEALNDLLPVTDLFMMDIKLLTPEMHRETTGVANDKILENAHRLALTGKPMILRTPIVPAVNDSKEEFSKIVSFIRSLLDVRKANGNGTAQTAPITFELLPFHRMASDKYESLGMNYRAASFDPPTTEVMTTLARIASDAGIDTRIR